jgi:hypothetical protein
MSRANQYTRSGFTLLNARPDHELIFRLPRCVASRGMGSATRPHCDMRKTPNSMIAKIRKRAVKLLDALDGSALTATLVALTLTMLLFWVLGDSSARLRPERRVAEAFSRDGTCPRGYYPNDGQICQSIAGRFSPEHGNDSLLTWGV